MKDICEGLPGYGHVLVWVAIFIWEFYLGKTKFGSTVEFVIDSVVLIVARLKGVKK